MAGRGESDSDSDDADERFDDWVRKTFSPGTTEPLGSKVSASDQALGDPHLEDTDEGRRDGTHWNGWGFADTRFALGEDGMMRLHGPRYGEFFQGQDRAFPDFVEFAETTLGLDLEDREVPQEQPNTGDYPEPALPTGFLQEIAAYEAGAPSVQTDVVSRIRHSHGHTCQEVFALRHQSPVPWRIPDAVILPESHGAVEAVVRAAQAHGVIVIPFGGGTSVTMALNAPEPLQSGGSEAPRPVVSLDMRRMNAIKWVDRNNMSACIEAGALGRDIETKLNNLGLTLGHAPDSSEFSTLGGWVATKSSGMKKNAYGNIEDILLDVRMVTAAVGTLSRGTTVERVSIGPDPVALAIGSEGTLGVVTEAVVRLRLKPAVQKYDSYVFADFRHGASAMREIALHRVAPASVRLMDNTQFKMGQALKPPAPKRGRWRRDLEDRAKKYYVTEYHGFDPNKLCAMVLLFEGNDMAQVRAQEVAVRRICQKYGGLRGGAESGVRGYFLTFMIAYLRDFGLDYGFLSESFETSVRWTDVGVVYERVRDRIRRVAAAEGVQAEPLVGGRVTQTYDTAAAMYFYFGIVKDGLLDPVATFSRIEHAAREEILASGGSLSHHHGIGKLRKSFYGQVTTEPERALLRGVKAVLDPNDVFGAGNAGFAELKSKI